MQRDRIALEEIASRQNLVLATWKAARGKRERPAIARFLASLDGNLNRLADEILSGRSPRGRARLFTIRDPKPRLITAACFADRVLHHAILNLAEPRFERTLVDSTFACRPDKGVHVAVAHVQAQLRRSGAWPWLVQIDIERYFPSIDHAVLRDLLARRFKGAPFLALLGRIIDAGSSPVSGRGLPIGSLTSQHFANAYLDGADRFLLEHQAVRAHARYMDDIVWWCPTLAAARESLAAVDKYLVHERRLSIKPTVHVGRSERGLQFCGFRIRAGVVLASSRKMKRYRAACQRVELAWERGKFAELDAQRAHDNVLATLHGTESSGFRRRLHAERGNDED